MKGADPAIGRIGILEEVEEERIEMVAPEASIGKILKAIVAAHPYDEPAIHVLPMEDYHNLLTYPCTPSAG